MAAAHLFGLGDAQMQPPLPQQAAPPPPAAAPALKKKRNQPGNPSKYLDRAMSSDRSSINNLLYILLPNNRIIIHTIIIPKRKTHC